MWRLGIQVSFLLAAALATPASAFAGASEDYRAVTELYERTGTVDACELSGARLASAKRGAPPDVDRSAPGLSRALDTALRRRAAGDCDGGRDQKRSDTKVARATPASPAAAPPAAPPASAATPESEAPAALTPVAATGATGATTTTPAPAPEAASAPGADDGSVASAADRTASATGAGDAPLPLVLLAVLLGLAALAGLAWAVARFVGFEPPWLAEERHAAAEAGWRVSASWAEFTDWLRLGR